jgi:hypothetical protein
MRRIFDCDPSHGAPARSTRDQAPGKLGGKAIFCARFQRVPRVGRQPAQEIEQRNGLITHRSAADRWYGNAGADSTNAVPGSGKIVQQQCW